MRAVSSELLFWPCNRPCHHTLSLVNIGGPAYWTFAHPDCTRTHPQGRRPKSRVPLLGGRTSLRMASPRVWAARPQSFRKNAPGANGAEAVFSDGGSARST